MRAVAAIQILLYSLGVLLLAGCERTERVDDIDPYTVLAERLYLGMEGDACLNALDRALAENDMSVALRCPAFIDRVMAQFRSEYLQGGRSEDIVVALIDFEQVRLFQPEPARSFGQAEYERLLAVQNARSGFLTAEISLTEVQRRFLDNYIFDQINMGCTNFVNVSFLYLLGRQPTRHELAAGMTMCQGDTATLFFQVAAGRRGLLETLTNNSNYLEHQLRTWHEFLFFRPASEEDIRTWMALWEGDMSIDAVLTHLLTTDPS